VRRLEGHLGVVIPNWHPTPFKVKLGYRHGHNLWKDSKAILRSWPPIDTFQRPGWVSAWPQVVKRLEGHLGAMTPNWHLLRSSLGTYTTISDEKTRKPPWGRDSNWLFLGSNLGASLSTSNKKTLMASISETTLQKQLTFKHFSLDGKSTRPEIVRATSNILTAKTLKTHFINMVKVQVFLALTGSPHVQKSFKG